jgi:hypothetical protein
VPAQTRTARPRRAGSARALQPDHRHAGDFERGERLLDDPGQALLAAGRLGGAVEAGEGAPDRDQVAVRERACGLAHGERGAFVVAAQLDRVLERERLAGRRDRQPVSPSREDRGDAEVDVRGEAPVELQLLPAALPPALERPVVQEGERDRLVDLVSAFAGEEDPRDVRLSQLDRLRAVRSLPPLLPWWFGYLAGMLGPGVRSAFELPPRAGRGNYGAGTA